jgi:hypothetical protein
MAFESKATVYTSIANGQYDNCNIWTNGCAPNEINVGDTVIVNHDVVASSSMQISGVLIINVSGQLTHVNDVDVEDFGVMEVNGTFSLTAELNQNGYYYNSGLSIVEYFHNDGFLQLGYHKITR